MPIKLKVTDMVVGEIIFPVVEGQTLKSNSTFILNEEQFNHFTIQSAINKGFLVIMENLKPIEDSNTMEEINHKNPKEEAEENISDEKYNEEEVCRDLNDQDRYDELKENNIKTLKSMAKDLSIPRYSKLNKNDLIESIIEIESFNKKDIENTKKTEEVEEVEEVEADEEPNKGMFIDLDEMTKNTEDQDINPQKDGIANNMGSWDAHEGSLLNKDDSSRAVRTQYNGVEQDIQTTQDNKDVDFSKKDDQENLDNAFNEIKKKVASISTVPKKKDGKKVSNQSRKAKSKGIKPVGEVRNEKSDIDADNLFVASERIDDLNFVDTEQRNNAIKNHPILGKKKEGR